MKERITAQSFGIKILVHLDHIARFPQVHQAMDLVDQRNDAERNDAGRGRRGDAATVVVIAIPHTCSCPLVPGFQTYRVSRTLDILIFPILFHLRVSASSRPRVLLGLATGTDQQVKLVGQGTV